MHILNKKKILWISPFAPYDKVSHAGGQDMNHTIKYLQANHSYDIHVASLCLKSDLPFIDLDRYNIANTLYTINKSKIKYHLGLRYDSISKFNIFHPNGNLLTPYTKFCFNCLLKKIPINLHPDIIILHWTQAALLIPKISKMYPTSIVVIIEVDVAYQGYKRRYLNSNNKLLKFIWQNRYKRLKKKELTTVNKSNLCIVLNEKDAQLLISEGVIKSKIFTSIPYYHNYSYLTRKQASNNVIYYGYMGRDENHLSALWFIQNVMPLLNENIHFTVIGTEPKEELVKLQNNRIHILGYIKDISPYLEEGLCMAAPLVLGAGIKIKILEGMSAGIPILTNSIGIEGIPAKDQHDFLYCTTKEDFANAINKLTDPSLNSKISLNARNFINENFNTDSRIDKLAQILLTL